MEGRVKVLEYWYFVFKQYLQEHETNPTDSKQSEVCKGTNED